MDAPEDPRKDFTEDIDPVLEALVRTALRDRARSAPLDGDLLRSVRAEDARRRDRVHRLRAAAPRALLAAAVVALVALGITFGVRGHSTGDETAGSNNVAGSGELSAGADRRAVAGPAASAPSAAGNSTQVFGGLDQTGSTTIGYHGIDVTVPAGLPVIEATCSYPRSYVSVAGWVLLHCPNETTPPPGPSGLQVTLSPYPGKAPPDRTVATTVSGRTAGERIRTGARTRGELYLPDPGVEVSVSGQSGHQVRAVLHSVEIRPRDPQGCVQQPADVVPVGPASGSTSMVPPGTTGAVVCDYANGHGGGTFLVSSYRVTPAQAHGLADLVDALPTTAGAPAATSSWWSWVRFGYRDGTTRTVAVRRADEPSSITDGTVTARDPASTVDSLLNQLH